jgi:hypothetical protein
LQGLLAAVENLNLKFKVPQADFSVPARSGECLDYFRIAKPGVIYPSKQELETELGRNSNYVDGIADLFKKMGITDQIKDKVRQPASGAPLGELVARGEADLGFEQISNLLHVNGIDYLGPLPPEIQNITIYSAGVHAQAPAPDVSICNAAADTIKGVLDSRMYHG